MKNSCASCQGISVEKVIKSDNKKKPKWLAKVDYVSDFISKTNLKLHIQKKTDTKLVLNAGKSKQGRYVLFWGALPSHQILPNDAKKAYGNFKNYGVTKVDKKGFVELKFNCPQPYSTIEKGKKQKETFYRHIHFCYSNNTNTSWLSTVYTKIVVCNLNKKETLELHNQGKLVLINALPASLYAKSHIPNSYNLEAKTIKKMTSKQLFEWMQQVVEINYPKIHKQIKEKKISIYELPILVYCQKSSCNFRNLAANEFLKKGFVNISEFAGGMDEYLKN